MTNSPPATGYYAPVNGLNLYYEVHGQGQPLIIIHGGFGTVGMFAPVLPMLNPGHQLIPVELQGHAHTADIDRPFRYEQLADDIAALIQHLGLANADVIGYSLGGGVALQTAIRHPALVRRLVVVSAPCKRTGWFPDVLKGMGEVNGEAMIGTPMHQAYVSSAPRPEDWPKLASKTRQLLSEDYDWSSQVAALTMPVLIAMADADSIPPAHAAEMFALLGGGKADAGWDGANRPASQLAILPNTTHYTSFYSPLLAGIVNAFLDAP